MESALAAAVVAEAAAATTGETAAQVGEAAAADEEEGEAAAAAKGKRTALRGLGGILSPLPVSAPGRGPALPGARGPCGGVRAFLAFFLAPPGSCPRWRGAGRPPSPAGRVGAGSTGPGLGSGTPGEGDRTGLSWSSAPGRAGVEVPCPRPAPRPVIWKREGGSQTTFFLGGGDPVWIKLTLGAQELRENQGTYVCVG